MSTPVTLRLPSDLLAQIDAFAARVGLDRASACRALMAAGLAPTGSAPTPAQKRERLLALIEEVRPRVRTHYPTARIVSVVRREPVLNDTPIDRSNHNRFDIKSGLIRKEFASIVDCGEGELVLNVPEGGPPVRIDWSHVAPPWIHGSTEIGISCRGTIVVPAPGSGEPAYLDPWVP